MIKNHPSTRPDKSDAFTLFQDRDLNGATFPPQTPARFSSEPEGEGLELCLRGLLVVCLFVGVTICGARLETFARSRDTVPAIPETQTAVAATHPATVHANEIL